MGLLQRLFGPNVTKLEERGDVDGLIAVADSDADSELRIGAIAALARIGDPPAITAVVERLASPDAEVAGAASAATSDLGGAAAPALVEALAGPAGDRALELLLALGPSALDPLRDATSKADETTRRLSLNGLLELRQGLTSTEEMDAIFRSLLASLGDADPHCRRLAAGGLHALGDPRAARALAAQLKDGDEAVRTACRRALAGLGEPAMPHVVDALMDRNHNSRRMAAAIAGKLGDGLATDARRMVLVALMDRVDDTKPEVRDAVASALASIPADAVVDEQLEALADTERSDRDELLEVVLDLLEHASVDARRAAAARERIRDLGLVPEG
jgi:HEAT repeat protein